MESWRRTLLAAGVALIAGGSSVFADGGSSAGGGGDSGQTGAGEVPCPHERACNLTVRFEHSGNKRRCGVGLRIFGVGGAILGQVCYDHETMIPAHQECHGVAHEGTRCVKESDMIVKTRDCKCGGLVLPFIDTGVPLKCKCGDYYNTGTIEDFMTQDC